MSSPELDRILSFPRVPWNQTEPLSPLLEKWRPSLWDAQLAALSRSERASDGQWVYCDMPVGSGKFLTGYLAPALCKARRAVAFTFPNLLKQSKAEVGKFRELFPEARDYEPEYISFGKLSHPKYAHILFEKAPDVIVIDEAHALCGAFSARRNRVMAYCKENPHVKVLVMSGTLDRDLEALYELAELSLRGHSFLPRNFDLVRLWGRVLNHGSKPHATDTARLKPLCDWAGTDDVHAAFRERYTTMPFVVTAPPAKVDAALHLRKWKPEVPAAVQSAVEGLREAWILPDGTELVDSLEIHRHGGTLSLGFYYKPIPHDDEDVQLEWEEARREWGRALRRQIQHLQWFGLDSPARVEQACQKNAAHKDVMAAYRTWVAIRNEHTPRSEVVWVDQSLVRAAVARVLAQPRGILWYASARAIEPILRDMGMCVYGAGVEAPTADVTHAALSQLSHGTGKNLQPWDWQLILEFPSSAIGAEQLLGRTHRPYQMSEVVTAEIATITPFQTGRLYSCLAKSRSAKHQFGREPKILNASWQTGPKTLCNLNLLR